MFAAVHDLVGLAVLGGEPRPGAELLGRVEAADVADLGHEDGGDDLAHPGQGHEGPIFGMTLELGVDAPVELGDGAGIDLEQVAQRVESQRVGLGELETVELGLTARTPQLADDRQNPVLGHDPVDLGLGTGPVRDERVARAHELAQLADLGRGDPGLGESSDQARSWASRSSFFTRRLPQLLPGAWARWTWAPRSWRTSAAQYQP